ncbi:MAG: hypothetical protein QJR03_08120 [Sphaerobacter sp.]|nr:hypothetical protein [Sphaerobacter sp.]
MAREQVPLARAIAGSVAAGAAYLAAQAADMRLLGVPTNDLRLLAGMVPGGEGRWRSLGTLIHVTNSVALGIAFTRVRNRVPGRGWRQGLLFALAENLVLGPLFLAIDRWHPAVRAGRLPRYGWGVPMLQQVLRHAAYGAVLGAVLGRRSA